VSLSRTLRRTVMGWCRAGRGPHLSLRTDSRRKLTMQTSTHASREPRASTDLQFKIFPPEGGEESLATQCACDVASEYRSFLAEQQSRKAALTALREEGRKAIASMLGPDKTEALRRFRKENRPGKGVCSSFTIWPPRPRVRCILLAGGGNNESPRSRRTRCIDGTHRG
jgi:hypothetical protein